MSLYICPNVVPSDETANILQGSVAVSSIVAFSSDGIPNMDVRGALFPCQDVGSLTLGNACPQEQVCLLSKMEEEVAQENGMLFFITNEHLQELITSTPDITEARKEDTV